MKTSYYRMGAAMTVGMLAASAEAKADSGNNFSSIAENITTSIQDIPGLISAISYLLGLLFAVLGILKIKDHVENPTQSKLADGAIRLAAGGCFFALPIILEAMFETVGEGDAATAATLNKVDFAVE